ncbi:hypothetical protein BLA29_006410, partial [Euroglyphus maynei]
NNNNNGQQQSQTIIVTTTSNQQQLQNGQPQQQTTSSVLHGTEVVHIKTDPTSTGTILQQQANNDNSVVHIKPESTTVLQHVNEVVHIKNESLDTLPPLSSPGQMVDVNANTALTPQYAVTPTAAAAARTTNGGTVYLTTDYITYREYYPTNATNANGIPQQQQQQQIIVTTNPAITAVNSNNSGDQQYHAVRQQLAAQQIPQVTITGNNNYQTAANLIGETETSFLDRYLRQQQQPITTQATTTTSMVNNNNNSVAQPGTISIQSLQQTSGTTSTTNGVVNGYKSNTTTLHGCLTVDLPSPDSGIGDTTTATPRQETTTTTTIPQVRVVCLSLVAIVYYDQSII